MNNKQTDSPLLVHFDPPTEELPGVKDMLREIAEAEGHSMTGAVNLLIRQAWMQAHGIAQFYPRQLPQGQGSLKMAELTKES